MKAYTDENGIKFIEVNRGKYSISGQIIDITEHKSKIKVESFDDIRTVSETKVVSYYSDGENNKDHDTFLSEKEKLHKHYNRETELWDTLDNEFEYRKFAQTWMAVYVEKQAISDPIKVTIENIVFDTKNEFICSEFVNGGDKTDLFLYRRKSAFLTIASNKFKSLGMEYKHGVSYSQTERKKVWSNSSHSCIKYISAFGMYPFTKNNGDPSDQRGSLDRMLSIYDTDKKMIEKVIQDGYIRSFGTLDMGQLNVDEFISLLKKTKSHLSNVEAKSKSRQSKMWADKAIDEALDAITALMVEEK